MKELIDHIPFLDLAILGTIALLVHLGWKHGFPRMFMVVGSLYSGFLLASIYYHMFALTLHRVFNLPVKYAADMLAFLIINTAVSSLMMALFLTVLGHVRITGRAMVFSKAAGSITGFVAAVLVGAIAVTLLRVPYEANKQNITVSNQLPIVTLFNDGFEKSMLPPTLLKTAPVLLSSVRPLLPSEVQDRGAVPLLQPVLNPKQNFQ